MMNNLKQWIIKKLGGYNSDEVLTIAVKELYNTIGADDILKEVNGIWMVGDKEITSGEKKLLIAESATFINTRLWKVLQNDIKYRANKMMFDKAKTEIDLIAGKLWLYTLDCMRTRLESMEQGKGNFNNP